MRPTGAFTLRDLISDRELTLMPRVRDDTALQRPVAGVSGAESAHGLKLVNRDWIILMPITSLPSSKVGRRSLIEKLDEASTCALGIGVESTRTEIPEDLLSESQARGYPIFTWCAPTTAEEVINTVFRRVLSPEIRTSHRLAAMQRFLIDALADPDPRSALIGRLASLLDATVVFLGRDRRPIASSGQLEMEPLLAAIEGRRRGDLGFTTDRHHGFAFAVGEPDPVGRLIVSVPAGRPLHALAKPVAQSAVPLLRATTRLEDLHLERERAIRREIYHAITDAADSHQARIAAASANPFGINPADGVAAVFISDPTSRRPQEELLTALENCLLREGHGFVAAAMGRGVAAIVAASADELRPLHDLVREQPGIRVGVGRVVRDSADITQSQADARIAAESIPTGDGTAITRYDSLDLATVLINEIPLDRLEYKFDQWLIPLRANPLICETVTTFLGNDLDVARTARRLHIHPNSVRYRLSRAEEIIGAKLRSPATILALHVALTSHDLRGAQDTLEQHIRPWSGSDTADTDRQALTRGFELVGTHGAGH